MQVDVLGRNPASRRVLGLLSTLAGAELHTREISRRTGLDVHSVQLALTHLLEVGLVRSRRLGNLRLWSIDQTSRSLEDLGALIRRETQVAEDLRSGLRAMPQVRVAFIFGSFAAVSDQADSDIDLFVVGSVDWNKIAELTQKVERNVGRPLNLVVWSDDDLNRPSSRQRSFITELLLQPRILLVGGESELEPAREAVARTLVRRDSRSRSGPNRGRGAPRDRTEASRPGGATVATQPSGRGAAPRRGGSGERRGRDPSTTRLSGQ
jgi:predicted nucleotidyltransferase